MRNPPAIQLHVAILACFGLVPSIGLGQNAQTSAPAQEAPQVRLITITSMSDPVFRNLNAVGVDLIQYHSGSTYLAAIPAGVSEDQLKAAGVTAKSELPASNKLSPALRNVAGVDSTDVLVLWTRVSTEQEVVSRIGSMARKLQDVSNIPNSGVVRVSKNEILSLAATDLLVWIEPALGEPELMNYESNEATRVTALSIPGIPGRDLLGKGVLIGLGDGGGPIQHVDFDHRILNYAAIGGGTSLQHAYLTAGMVGSAGNVNPRHAGPAPAATIYTERFGNILTNLKPFIDRGGVITSNSWGNPGSYGVYSATSSWMDQQATDNPQLLHVFAAGNSGGLTIAPYANGFNTIYGHYQSAKNLISVGMLWHEDSPHAGSSKGPTTDGRIKPDICAVGVQVVSTFPGNGYGTGYSGTSFACPGAAGAIALLYERYRQLHAGANPDAALVKALVCNSADDLGNPGPDYSFGWGRINARRAVECLEKGQWISGSIANGQTVQHNITVPAGARGLRVMIYWADEPAAPYAPVALVNDLDLSVITPASTTEYPWVLDKSPTGVQLPATRGNDHTNNIEQVVVLNPANGSYNVQVYGFNVPFGPQAYYLVYEVLMPDITVTYPAGGESLVPGETEYVRWDAPAFVTDSLTLSYSPDNGLTWSVVSSAVAGNSKAFAWTVPSGNTSLGRIRVTSNATGISGESIKPFGIVPVPGNVAVTVPCPGFISLTWDSIPAASGYEVMMLDTFMKPVLYTTNASAELTVDDPDKTYWIAVRAIEPGGAPGRRCVSIQVTPNVGSICPWTDELVLDTVRATPAHVGRQFTTGGFGLHPVAVTVINRGTNAVAGFDLSYTVNGFTHTETSADSLGSGDTLDFIFAVPFDFSAPGTYDLNASVIFPGDATPSNNSLQKAHTLTHLPNLPVTLPFAESFESTQVQQTSGPVCGLAGMPAADFESSSPYGSLRCGISAWPSKSGKNAATLDVGAFASMNTNFLTYTINLSNYTNDTLFMDFSVMHHGETFQANDCVWIRGSDSDPWIRMLQLPFGSWQPGVFNTLFMLAVTDSLTSHGQQASSSFQVRFGQEGQMPAAELTKYAGYSLDDILIHTRPRAFAGIDATICGTHTTQVGSPTSATGGVPPYTYKWTPAIGLNSDTLASPSASPFVTTTYTLTVTDALGLIATDEVTVEVVPCLPLEVRAILQGPYDPSTGLMRDVLRSSGLIPAGEPYASMGYVHASGGGSEQVNDTLFDQGGSSAVVDWIVVELRAAADPATVLASQSALLQRNGFITGADGGELIFREMPYGSYFVAVHHRNHLGVMSKTALDLTAEPLVVDFTLGPVTTFGDNAQKQLATGVYGLWAGNTNGNKKLEYAGTAGDRASILSKLPATDLTDVQDGYSLEDVNLDGLVKYTGRNNDRAVILRNVGGLLPEGAITEQVP